MLVIAWDYKLETENRSKDVLSFKRSKGSNGGWSGLLQGFSKMVLVKKYFNGRLWQIPQHRCALLLSRDFRSGALCQAKLEHGQSCFVQNTYFRRSGTTAPKLRGCAGVKRPIKRQRARAIRILGDHQHRYQPRTHSESGSTLHSTQHVEPQSIPETHRNGKPPCK